MPNKKAQTAVELLIVSGFLIFFFIMFVGAIQSRIQEKSSEKINIVLKDTAKIVQEEIELATSSSDGYHRTFTLPQRIVNENYDISIFEGIVYVNTTNNKQTIALNIKNATGSVQKGTNTIEKQNGIVYLNQ